MICSMILASDVAKAVFPQSRNFTKRPWLRRYRAAASATFQRRVKSNSLLGLDLFETQNQLILGFDPVFNPTDRKRKETSLQIGS